MASSDKQQPRQYKAINQNGKYLTPEEQCENLTSKLRNFKNVIITERKMENQLGVFYGIDVKIVPLVLI